MELEEYDKLLEVYLGKTIDEYVEYSFINYENSGELVGKYRYDPKLLLHPEFETWQLIDETSIHENVVTMPKTSFPSFFGETDFHLRPLRITGDLSKRMLSSKGLWPDKSTCVVSMDVMHQKVSATRTVLLDQKGRLKTGEDVVFFGEFYLLINSIKAIKRFNLMTELLQKDLNKDSFTHLDGEFSYPDSTAKGAREHFVKWKFGFQRVPEEARPRFLAMKGIKPTPCNMIHTESRRRWHSMRDGCLSWKSIYDKTNFSTELSSTNIKPGNYLCSIRAVINWDDMKEYLDKQFIVDDYVSAMEYSLVMYPPSIYMYPADAITEVTEPLMSSVSLVTDKVIFKTPRVYKTDGNFHYVIKIFDREGDRNPLFSSSSLLEHSDYEKDKWFYSKDEETTYELIPPGTPTFNNVFEDRSGTDAIYTTHVKYSFSSKLYALVRDSPSIIFKIYQIDGTRSQMNGKSFSLSYNIEKN